jgi:ribulose-5-phosphate 4-epimerase/fuculose-1-phosphate aldolase
MMREENPMNAPASHSVVPSLRDKVSEAEWAMRVDLAACYRVVAHYGWDDLVFTHISARVPGGDHHFLINPYGMLFEEVTTSSLVKVDLAQHRVDQLHDPINRLRLVAAEHILELA